MSWYPVRTSTTRQHYGCPFGQLWDRMGRYDILSSITEVNPDGLAHWPNIIQPQSGCWHMQGVQPMTANGVLERQQTRFVILISVARLKNLIPASVCALELGLWTFISALPNITGTVTVGVTWTVTAKTLAPTSEYKLQNHDNSWIWWWSLPSLTTDEQISSYTDDFLRALKWFTGLFWCLRIFINSLQIFLIP